MNVGFVFGRSRLLMLATLAVLFAPAPALATIMYYLEVEDLTRLSTDIFEGEVIGTGTYWNAERTRIYTKVEVRVNESFKGAGRRNQVVTITQLGGEKDGIRMDYAGRPEYAIGERVVLFTTRGRNNDYLTIGLKQGKMRVEGNEVRRDFSGITLVQLKGSGKNQQPLAIKTNRLSLDELRLRISRTR